jgi:hypothetical protein
MRLLGITAAAISFGIRRSPRVWYGGSHDADVQRQREIGEVAAARDSHVESVPSWRKGENDALLQREQIIGAASGDARRRRLRLPRASGA